VLQSVDKAMDAFTEAQCIATLRNVIATLVRRTALAIDCNAT
jgi:hypothetical protein